jgi:hypothetical protein
MKNVMLAFQLKLTTKTTPIVRPGIVTSLSADMLLMDLLAFDKILQNIDSEPLKADCIIWYQYMYHIDRNGHAGQA